jgi:hypothetical protein
VVGWGEPGAVDGGWGCAANDVETHARRMRARDADLTVLVAMGALWHQDVGKLWQTDDTCVGELHAAAETAADP